MESRDQLPPEFAAYFAQGRRRITAVQPNPDYTLTLSFDNGERRLYDVKPLIDKGGVMTALGDAARFNRVRLDEGHSVAWDIDPNVDSSVVWENVIDLCPDCCYVYSKPIQ